MSHLEAALRRAIAGLDPSDRAARRIALGNVRASMMRLLAVYEPPLSADEIEGKIDELDALIAEIEAEFAPTRPASARPSFATIASGPDEPDYDEDEPDTALEETPDLDDAYEMPEEAAVPAPRRPDPRLVGAIAVLLASIAGAAVFVALSPGSGGSSATPPVVAENTTPESAAPAQAESPATTPTTAPGETASEPSASPAEQQPSAAAPAGDAPAPSPVPATTPATTSPAPAASDAASASSPAAAPAAPAPVAPPPGPAASESMIVFDGHDPQAFRTTADNPVRFEGDPSGGSVRISSSATSNGARLTVGPGVYQRLAGRTIRVVVVAKAASDSPAANLRMAYLSGRKLSPWTDETLGKDYTSLAMTWTVPSDRAGKQDDAVLIEPGIPGDQTAVDIRSVTIDLLP